MGKLSDQFGRKWFLCAAATICLMLGLTWGGGRVYAWTSVQVIGMLAAGIVFFAVFLFAGRRAAEPILPLELFRNRTFSVGALLALLQMMVLMGFSLYLPLFFQGVLSVSPTGAGLVMTPFSLSMVFGAVLASTAMNRVSQDQEHPIGTRLNLQAIR